MFLIIIAAILYGVSFVLDQNPRTTSVVRPMRFGAVALCALGLLMACVKQIDAGAVGVQKLFGKVDDRILESGLNVVNPLISVTDVNVRTQNYTMSSISSEGQKEGDDAIRILSTDGLELTIDLTVLYRVNPVEAPRIVREVGRDYEGVLVRPITRTKIRDNAVYYTAIELYSTKREEFQNKIYHAIDSLFKSRGLVLEQLLIRNIALPESVKGAIEEKIRAEQEAQKMQYVLQKERQEADRKRVEAQGIADYQKILSSGLNDKMLQYEQIKAQKELANSQNAKVIIMGSGKSAPILINQ